MSTFDSFTCVKICFMNCVDKMEGGVPMRSMGHMECGFGKISREVGGHFSSDL